MDGFLLAMIACLFVETGDRGQSFASDITRHGTITAGILFGTFAACLTNATLGMVAARILYGQLHADARTLFLAVTLLVSGISLFITPKLRKPVDGRSNSGNPLRSFVTMLVFGLGGASQFLITGIGVGTGKPVLAACGGWLGMSAGIWAAAIVGRHTQTILPVLAIRRFGGLIACLLAVVLAYSALSR